MKAHSPTLKLRVEEFITKAGSTGVTKTQVMQRFQLKAVDVEMLLGVLLTEKRIKQQFDPARRLGRPALRLFAPTVELEPVPLTRAEKSDIPVLPFGVPPTRSSPCQVCGAAIPMPEVGRPYVYCSDACRRASRDGGATLKDFLARATDARIFARAALCLVMADLSIRGFQIAGDVFGPALRLIVHDNTGLLFLDVVVIPDSGHFPPPENYDSAAFVYRDGRIVYTGRTPLVQEDAQPTGDANVEPGSGSEI